MKSTSKNITQAQLNNALKAFRKEMLLIMEDFAYYGAFISQHHHNHYLPKTDEGNKLFQKALKHVTSKRYKTQQRKRSKMRIDAMFSDMKSH